MELKEFVRMAKEPHQKETNKIKDSSDKNLDQFGFKEIKTETKKEEKSTSAIEIENISKGNPEADKETKVEASDTTEDIEKELLKENVSTNDINHPVDNLNQKNKKKKSMIKISLDLSDIKSNETVKKDEEKIKNDQEIKENLDSSSVIKRDEIAKDREVDPVEKMFYRTETPEEYKEKWMEIFEKNKKIRNKTIVNRKIENGRFTVNAEGAVTLLPDQDFTGRSSNDILRMLGG